MESILQYLTFCTNLIKDSLLSGVPIGLVVYFILSSRGVTISALEIVLDTAGIIFCLLVLQFLIHSKNELYNMIAREQHSNDEDDGDDDE